MLVVTTWVVFWDNPVVRDGTGGIMFTISFMTLSYFVVYMGPKWKSLIFEGNEKYPPPSPINRNNADLRFGGTEMYEQINHREVNNDLGEREPSGDANSNNFQ